MLECRLQFVLSAFLLSACGPDGPDQANATFQVDTLQSGLVRVVNDGGGAWTPETAWRLEQDLRLGTVDGDGPEQFSQVAWIQEDSAGHVYVLDYLAQEIRVFSPTGEYSRTIGQKGEGPGELMSAAGLNWGPDGNLWVWESRRFSAFTPSGEFVTSYPRLTWGVIYPWNGGFVDDVRYIDWGLARQRGANPDETTGLTTFYPIHFTPPDTYDTFPPLQFNAWMGDPGRRLVGENKGIMLAQTEDGHIWFAHTDEYTLFKRTLEGDTLLSASIPSRPDMIPPEEIDSVIRSRVERGFPVVYEPDDFVTERRLVTRVLVDDLGYVYVLPQEPGVPEGTAIDVIEESGVYLGRMALDETVLTRGPPPYITRDHVYGVVNDEFDVPFVVRWRILRP
jgi:hypothetical protein